MPGTITGTIERFEVGGRPSAKIILTCTADADAASYPATVINTLENIAKYDIRGMFLSEVKTIPGSTGPTDDTDFTITDEYGVDILGSRGTNAIDNATKNHIVAGVASNYQPALITGNLTLTITNNSVKSAVVTIVLNLIG